MKRGEQTSAAKFRATCETCGQKQPRATTAWTVERWMHAHERAHRLLDGQPGVRGPEDMDTASPPTRLLGGMP